MENGVEDVFSLSPNWAIPLNHDYGRKGIFPHVSRAKDYRFTSGFSTNIGYEDSMINNKEAQELRKREDGTVLWRCVFFL